MTLAKRQDNAGGRRKFVTIDGDDIKILNSGFEISCDAWKKFKGKMQERWPDDYQKKKSQAIRILINAINLDIINLEDLEKQIEKNANDVKDIIYI